MDNLQRLKLKLGDIEEGDNLLSLFLDESEEEIKSYCNIEEAPKGLIIDIAIVKYNRRGTEGLSSEGYSGVSNSFIDGYPQDIKNRLNKIRKISRL